ncbi:MAG: IS110 family transposase [Candidatus Zixiibacteriota bacterium]
MDKSRFCVGVDVGKDELVVAIADKKTRFFGTTTSEVRRMYRWLNKCSGGGSIHLGMEATGVYSTKVALKLVEYNQTTVSVINPAQIAAHGRVLLKRTKTDSVDAQVILDFVIKHCPLPWQPPSEAHRRLSSLVTQADAIKAEIGQWRSRQHAHKHTPELPREVTSSAAKIMKTLQQELVKIEAAIEQLCQQDMQLAEDIAIATSIVGIGNCSAAQILAYGGDALTQRTRRQLDAHAGLAPAQRQSGTSVRGKPHLAKQGNARLRRALYMPTLVAVHHNPVLMRYYRRLIDKGKLKKVALAACMRKMLNIIRAMLIKRERFNPQYQPLT